MGEKLSVGPVNKGLKTDREPFVIDNDSFPVLVNAYQWRGRIKRKRGTSTLGRLQRGFSFVFIGSFIGGGGGAVFTGNLISILGLESTATIIPGSIGMNGIRTNIYYWSEVLPPTGSIINPDGNPGSTINYSTGDIFLTENAAYIGRQIYITFSYYPNLPVMGCEDFAPNDTDFLGSLDFDTTYSYNISTTFPYPIWDVSFYKNPPNGSYPGYTAKNVWTRLTWNGNNYQQFWTINYEGAFWATNGIDIDPFTGTHIGMQFARSSTITWVSNTATTIVLTITGSPLVEGDFVFLNEFTGPDAAASQSLNFQSGYVTTVAGSNYTITLPNANVAAGPYTPGIVQYLTTRSDPTRDCIRWYDGDPTKGIPPNPSSSMGWVNFMPPISQSFNTIAGLPPAQYYLVGARIITSFKDRLLFFGAVVQASNGPPIYLQDTVVYSQNGTPYYTASFQGDPRVPDETAGIESILVPDNQTAFPAAWFDDSTGFGGFQTAALDLPITTVSANEDALIVGFDPSVQARFLYTGNDILPFDFFIINSELGSSSTFSIINMDQGVLTRGPRGFVISGQTSATRFDLEIPDQVFQINLTNNGTERMCAQRDFINEWVYFTYSTNLEDPTEYIFPNQTLQYNYRHDSWAIFNECYTTYGQFRPFTGYTWLTVPYSSWLSWNEPWNAGSSTLLQPKVIAGNQQGFIMFREQGTSEGASLGISAITGSQITSPNHCLNVGDYITISGCIGTNVNLVNSLIFSVSMIVNADNFILNPSLGGTITYIGGGLITRMYVPFIQTKQFPTAWGMGRKTRLGPQLYLLSATTNAQITLLIYLSQDDSNQWNNTPIVPSDLSTNNSLIYSTVLYTCPESTNLGLTPANTNLQQLNQLPSGTTNQQQIWHRVNTSLIGDTIQLGFTMSDSQMRGVDVNGFPICQFAEIELHGFILDVSPSQILA